MIKRKILDEVLLLPRKFDSIGTVSIITLMKETGYSEIRDQISVEDIRAALIQCPEYIDEWMSYSEENRSNSGWYIHKEGSEKYIVGYFYIDSNGFHSTEKEYSDRFEACAQYIKSAIERLLKYI